MSDERGSFASAFRELIIPDLERAIAHHAAGMANDTTTFSTAMGSVMGEACRRGAGYLPTELYDDLCEWAATTLLDEAALAVEARDLIERLMFEPHRDILRKAVREFLNVDSATEVGNE